MEHAENPPKKLRSACDTCHRAKMRCSGGRPCAGCLDSGHACSYSVSHRVGRPKGTKNKRTLETMRNQQQQRQKQQQQQLPKLQQSSEAKAEASANLVEPLPLRPSVVYISGRSDNLSSFGNMFLDTAAATDRQNLFSPLPHGDAPWDPAAGNFVGELAMEHGQDTHLWGVKDAHSISGMHDNMAYIYPPNMFGEGENELHQLNSSSMHFSKRGADSPRCYPAPTSLSSLSSSPPPSPSRCQCLQHHADLLCRLKDVERGQIRPSIDLVLTGAQQALEPWNRLIRCPVCHQNDDPEVLLLSAMSIRAVLRRVQGLFCESVYPHNAGGSPDGSDHGIMQQKIPSGRYVDHVPLTVGIYEVTGEERALVTDLLLRSTLGKIEFALRCLKEKLERYHVRRISLETSRSEGEQGRMVESGGGAAETDHVEQILRGLESTVQMLGTMLGTTLRNAHLASPHPL